MSLHFVVGILDEGYFLVTTFLQVFERLYLYCCLYYYALDKWEPG